MGLVRTASGLVRQISPMDVFVYNVVIISIGIGNAFVFLFVPSFYPGANMTLSILLTTIFTLVESITYAIFAAAMPRTGGDYVYVSRSLHPALGLALNFNFVVWLIFFIAWGSQAVSTLGLSTLFSSLAVVTGDSGYQNLSATVSSPVGAFVIGSTLIVLSCILLIVRTRAYFRLQNYSFIIALAGVLISIFLLASNTHANFILAFESHFGAGTYQKVIDAAKTAGYAQGGFDLAATVLSFTWAFLALGFSVESASFGGEIRDVKKSQLLGMPGSLLFAGLIMTAWAWLASNTVGVEFLGAVGYLSFVNPSASPIAGTPWIGLLSSLLTNNTILVVIMGLSFALWPFYWIGGNFMFTSRCMLAWSIDGTAPTWLSKVSRKFHTPYVTMLTSLVGAEIFLYLFLFTPYITTLVGILGLTFTFFVVSAAAIAFPFRAKPVFETSPINYKVGGIPLISLLGAASLLFTGYMIYLYFIDPTSAATNPSSLAVMAGAILAGGVMYFAFKEYRKRKGVQVDLAFKEIPVE